MGHGSAGYCRVVRKGGQTPPIVQSLTRSHVLLCNLVLPYIAQPGAFLEVCAACVLLEVVHLVTLKQVAQNGSVRRLPIYIFLKTFYNLISPYIVQPGMLLKVFAVR